MRRAAENLAGRVVSKLATRAPISAACSTFVQLALAISASILYGEGLSVLFVRTRLLSCLEVFSVRSGSPVQNGYRGTCSMCWQ